MGSTRLSSGLPGHWWLSLVEPQQDTSSIHSTNQSYFKTDVINLKTNVKCFPLWREFFLANEMDVESEISDLREGSLIWYCSTGGVSCQYCLLNIGKALSVVSQHIGSLSTYALFCWACLQTLVLWNRLCRACFWSSVDKHICSCIWHSFLRISYLIFLLTFVLSIKKIN